MALILRQSSIHSSGCYTTTNIKKKTFIVPYTGPEIGKRMADRLYKNARRTYLFGLDEGRRVIDGTNIAAFINHSCDPNCETDEVEGQVWIIAMRDIKAGEELTYDYNLYDGDETDGAVCRCGAKGCRGAMYSEEEMAKRKRAAARTRRKRKSAAGEKGKPLTAAQMTRKRSVEAQRRRTRKLYTRIPYEPQPFRRKKS
jgi:hypothetical protein